MGAYVLTIRYLDCKRFNYVKTTPLPTKHNTTWIFYFFNKPTNTCIIKSFFKLSTKGIIINRIPIIVAQG